MLFTLLASILSVLQMEEGFKQITYGVVIITMVLFYARTDRVQV